MRFNDIFPLFGPVNKLQHSLTTLLKKGGFLTATLKMFRKK